jgi:hypothetical protein
MSKTIIANGAGFRKPLPKISFYNLNLTVSRPAKNVFVSLYCLLNVEVPAS